MLRRLEARLGPLPRPLPACLPPAIGGPHTRVVHAPGGSIPAGVSGAARRSRHPRDVQRPGAGRRDLAAAAAAHGPRRRHRVQRHHGAPRGSPIHVRIEPGRGPVVGTPVRTPADLDRLRPLEPSTDVPEALEAIRLLRKELAVPLIGFAGAPFTLASYLIEGGPQPHPRAHQGADARRSRHVGRHDASARRASGASAAPAGAGGSGCAGVAGLRFVGVGALDRDDYRRRVQPHMSSLFAGSPISACP